MFELINRLIRSFMTGCFVLLLAVYLLIEKAISTVFYETAVPVSAVALQRLDWSSRDYALNDRQFTIEVAFRNMSPLKLIGVEVEYVLLDCPTAMAPRDRCRPVQSSAQSTSVDTPAGFRGRFTSSFIVPNMASPEGVLVLDAKLVSATGMRDNSDRN